MTQAHHLTLRIQQHLPILLKQQGEKWKPCLSQSDSPLTLIIQTGISQLFPPPTNSPSKNCSAFRLWLAFSLCTYIPTAAAAAEWIGFLMSPDTNGCARQCNYESPPAQNKPGRKWPETSHPSTPKNPVIMLYQQDQLGFSSPPDSYFPISLSAIVQAVKNSILSQD